MITLNRLSHFYLYAVMSLLISTLPFANAVEHADLSKIASGNVQNFSKLEGFSFVAENKMTFSEDFLELNPDVAPANHTTEAIQYTTNGTDFRFDVDAHYADGTQRYGFLIASNEQYLQVLDKFSGSSTNQMGRG